MTKKRILLWGINGAILLSAGAGLWGLNQDLSQSQARLQEAQTAMSQAESDKGQLSSDLAAAQAEKESLALDKLELEFKEKMGKQKVIVGKVFSNGYLKKHGNHYHFVYGKPPVDAIYEDQAQAGASSSRRGGDDHYVFNPADIVEENADGYVVRHGDHFHFISKRDLANAPTVPNAHTPGGCRLVRIPHGDHFHDVLDCGQGLGNLSFDDEPVSPRPNGPVASRPASPSQPVAPSHPADQLTRPSQPATPSLPVDQPASPSPAPSQPEQPSTPQGPTSLLTLDSPEIQGHLDYISYAYGVERDTIKLQAVYDDAGNYRGQVFAFQNTEQGQDKSHIHPWVVPLWTLEVPSQDSSIDPELRFARELAGLAKRMGIPQRIIRIRDGYFEVPHGDHSHNIRIRNVEGAKAYVANKLASLPSIHVPGDLDEATVKAYIATLCLGQATDTGDAEGSIIATSHDEISQTDFQVACQQHLGAQQQLPPMYSALKHQGKPLYQYARQGIDIQRQPRNIHIHDIQILRFQFPEAQISVQCSKGTYIRTLAEDIAKSAHTLAHLTALRRTATAGFQIEHSHSIESLAALTEAQRDALLLPCDALVQHLPQYTASEPTIRALRFGQTPAAPPELSENTPLRIYATNGEFIGLVTSQQGYLKALRLMSTQAD